MGSVGCEQEAQGCVICKGMLIRMPHIDTWQTHYQFKLVVDEFENGAGRKARDKRYVGYGQVQAYIQVTLPAHSNLNTKKDVPVIIALVQLCKTVGEDASTIPIRYKDRDMEAVCAFDVETIGGVIGQVKTGKWWGIINRCFGPQQITICDIQELEYESEDNFSISCCM